MSSERHIKLRTSGLMKSSASIPHLGRISREKAKHSAAADSQSLLVDIGCRVSYTTALLTEWTIFLRPKLQAAKKKQKQPNDKLLSVFTGAVSGFINLSKKLNKLVAKVDAQLPSHYVPFDKIQLSSLPFELTRMEDQGSPTFFKISLKIHTWNGRAHSVDVAVDLGAQGERVVPYLISEDSVTAQIQSSSSNFDVVSPRTVVRSRVPLDHVEMEQRAALEKEYRVSLGKKLREYLMRNEGAIIKEKVIRELLDEKIPQKSRREQIVASLKNSKDSIQVVAPKEVDVLKAKIAELEEALARAEKSKDFKSKVLQKKIARLEEDNARLAKKNVQLELEAEVLIQHEKERQLLTTSTDGEMMEFGQTQFVLSFECLKKYNDPRTLVNLSPFAKTLKDNLSRPLMLELVHCVSSPTTSRMLSKQEHYEDRELRMKTLYVAFNVLTNNSKLKGEDIQYQDKELARRLNMLLKQDQFLPIMFLFFPQSNGQLCEIEEVRASYWATLLKMFVEVLPAGADQVLNYMKAHRGGDVVLRHLKDMLMVAPLADALSTLFVVEMEERRWSSGKVGGKIRTQLLDFLDEPNLAHQSANLLRELIVSPAHPEMWSSIGPIENLFALAFEQGKVLHQDIIGDYTLLCTLKGNDEQLENCIGLLKKYASKGATVLASDAPVFTSRLGYINLCTALVNSYNEDVETILIESGFLGACISQMFVQVTSDILIVSIVDNLLIPIVEDEHELLIKWLEESFGLKKLLLDHVDQYKGMYTRAAVAFAYMEMPAEPTTDDFPVPDRMNQDTRRPVVVD